MKRAYCLFVSVLLSSCDSAMEWKDGPYQVKWVNIYENRKLGYVQKDGFFVVRVEAEIKSVGSNDSHLVVEQLTRETKEINYYYIDKISDDGISDLSDSIHGPLNADEFEGLKKKLNLPNFSKKF